ncbi:DUF1427 family protein [Herminiimonas sp. KBW02]|uniref:DUF1427 family protein n=1 Tax=Herminiimonas sp. KBW02 TaxID=2153363 RepID=UPI001F408021|nr:DUF1427 family protein [Herminiimonas sp. KBW02]
MMIFKRYSMYLMSIGAGVLVGVIYGLLHVRSPAPPAIALLGLLGMLIGEQLVPIATRIIQREPITLSWFCENCSSKITGVDAAEQNKK